MKKIVYKTTDKLGIHARPAGQLVKQATTFKSTIKISNGSKEVDAKRIMGVMSLGVKQGDQIIVKIEGEDEEAALQALQSFVKENL